MKTRTVTMILCAALVALCALTGARAAQQRVNANSNTERGGADVKQVPGKNRQHQPAGNIIHLELDEGVIQQNLFDLDKRTIRFTPVAPKPEGAGGPLALQPGSKAEPVAGGFRAENLPLQWDAATGAPLQGNEVRLTKFQFPFSGRTWDAMQVTATGPHRLWRRLQRSRAWPLRPYAAGRSRHRQQDSAHRRVHQAADERHAVRERARRPPGRHVGHERADERAAGRNVTRTPHHYQAVLYNDGRIDLSYREMTARDAVVGVYTVPAGGAPATTSIDLSNVKPTDAPRPVIFEAFHHYGLPGSRTWRAR